MTSITIPAEYLKKSHTESDQRKWLRVNDKGHATGHPVNICLHSMWQKAVPLRGYCLHGFYWLKEEKRCNPLKVYVKMQWCSPCEEQIYCRHNDPANLGPFDWTQRSEHHQNSYLLTWLFSHIFWSWGSWGEEGGQHGRSDPDKSYHHQLRNGNSGNNSSPTGACDDAALCHVWRVFSLH